MATVKNLFSDSSDTINWLFSFLRDGYYKAVKKEGMVVWFVCLGQKMESKQMVVLQRVDHQ